MRYRKSKIDHDLERWFKNDNSRGLLRRIVLVDGEIRGLNALDMTFDYPITVIAGKNGVGKSTVLALACCAYHNTKRGYKLPKRQTTYYTFSDFFVQHRREVPPQGVRIGYFIAHNNWSKSKLLPDGVGVGYQVRQKKNGGKWNDYSTRVVRNVVFLGIERIVPHVERSQSRSYSKSFKEGEEKGWEDKVKNVVGYILGRDYDSYRVHEHSKYNIPVVSVDGVVYSGLNMGAGENALFEIFSNIYACGPGGLLVLDEIELGLHTEAQIRFLKKLKCVCLEMHTQVICTTHSKDIFDCLPSEARYFIEDVNGRTTVTKGISSGYAFAKLSGVSGNELMIFVEDPIAKCIVETALAPSTTKRVTVRDIGSASCLARQMAAARVSSAGMPVFSVFDGDQRSKESDNIATGSKALEKDDKNFNEWFRGRINYLPGTEWPEKWIFERCIAAAVTVAPYLRMDKDTLVDIARNCIRAGKHNEFYEYSKLTGATLEHCLSLIVNAVCCTHLKEFEGLEAHILSVLDRE